METCPKSVTVISWLFIVGGAFGLIREPFQMMNPEFNEILARSLLAVPVQYVMGCISMVVLIVCGIAMLKARHWGRYLYAIWNAFSIAVGLLTFPARALLIPGVVVYCLIVSLLFRPEASRYFTKTEPLSD